MDHNSTLYQILGVRKSASSSRIRAAYRSKAKTAHPDIAGGNAEAFASIKRAHDVLMNPETRAHYDKTGEIRERAIDQGRIAVFTLLSSAIDEALQAAENTGVDVASEDMLTAIKKVVDLHIQQLDQKCKAFTQRKEKANGAENSERAAAEPGEQGPQEPVPSDAASA
jgi:curved DNA-binding protein CbpA